jgi:Arylsulfotransferase (ASST)
MMGVIDSHPASGPSNPMSITSDNQSDISSQSDVASLSDTAAHGGAASRRSTLSRRQLLKGAGGVAGLAALGGGALGAVRALGGRGPLPRIGSDLSDSGGSVREFVSRPDLRPPVVSVTGTRAADGYVLTSPFPRDGSQPGPLIFDRSGQPVWFRPLPGLRATNFQVGRYRDEPVLIWWEGTIPKGYGQGEAVIVDSSYREVARVRAGNGRQMDLHELLLTPQGTMLFTCFPENVPTDLSPVGGPSSGTVRQSVIQEVDVRTGRVLLEWRSLEHVDVSESYASLADQYDYLHANSIDVAPDGNLLISARHTFALYKLDRQTGQVIWRLGGKQSDFQMGRDAQFFWQHDARALGANMITVFDDGAGPSKDESQSRAIALEVDEAAKTARLARSFRHPKPLLADAMGSARTLPDGHVIVGWGTEPYISEFAPDGRLLADAHFESGSASYRAFRHPWQARPSEPPVATAKRTPDGGRGLYVSWNGATEVSHWELSRGPSPDALRPVGIAQRRGFETMIPLKAGGGYARATAVDGAGRRLAGSRVVRL